ncbi:hypothetical protein COLO4_28311 [Corchorus olitorius]|uniref:Zinc knuckle CX2CX4HX4C n=1 Tax=Corchorus olitorius TaxID=93759 RepID=A0A1R3HLW6_9ROSI|nr:hypothetical protein COLO4_28311 [Corchorus olitorius]
MPFLEPPLFNSKKHIQLLSSFIPLYKKMNRPGFPRIRILRECSWTDSDTSSQESGDSGNSNPLGLHPRPSPEIRNRRSHRIRIPTAERYITRAWELRGEAVVIGREDDRYLIHFNSAIDRTVGILGNPWCMDGAILVVQQWNPNTTLPERMTETAGQVLGIDWANSWPTNVRFMRIRLRVDLNEPLTPGVTLDTDDGASRWIQFSYERINKLCMSCGMIGHTHPNCNLARTEVDRRINHRLITISQRYGYPIVVDDTQPFFSNEMRAFRNRARRRNTRLIYSQNQNRRRLQNGDENRDVRVEEMEQEQETEQVQIPPAENPAQNEANQLRRGRNEGDQTRESQGSEENFLLASEEFNDNENEQDGDIQGAAGGVGGDSHIIDLTIGEGDHNDRGQEMQDDTQVNELSVLTPVSLLQPEPLPIRPPQITYQTEVSDYPPYSPISDPMFEFDNTVNRVQSIYERYEGGFENLADYEDMMFAIAREQSRFEHVCAEVVRHSGIMLDGIQNRHLNDPFDQPNDNQPRWINMPGGGIMYTNAKYVAEEGQRAESSAMGERRNREPRMMNREDIEFQLSIRAERNQQENARNIGEVWTSFSLQNFRETALPAITEEVPVVDTGPGEEQSDRGVSPGFICTVNEEDLVAAFLKDTPSPTEEQAEDNTEKEEEQEDRKGKRVRDQDEIPSDTDLEGGRRIRQRLQDLEVDGKPQMEVDGESELGLRQTVPQQSPNYP